MKQNIKAESLKSKPENSSILEYDPFYSDSGTSRLPVPSDGECYGLWDTYAMPDHIREHSMRVGDIAQAMTERASEVGTLPGGTDVQAVKAAALLHDLAKSYSIEYGGQHAQLGAAWVLEETRNPVIAQAVLHHVWWPLDADLERHFLALAVLYADKRVKHEKIVSVGVRYVDLFERYAKNDYIRKRIEMTMHQSMAVEAMFEEILGVDLNACTFDSGRLVERT